MHVHKTERERDLKMALHGAQCDFQQAQNGAHQWQATSNTGSAQILCMQQEHHPEISAATLREQQVIAEIRAECAGHVAPTHDYQQWTSRIQYTEAQAAGLQLQPSSRTFH